MCGGRSQTVTQKSEIDPVLRAHLYGGPLPASAMTGIVPAYFQPGGTLGAYAGNLDSIYSRSPVTEAAAPVAPVNQGGDNGDSLVPFHSGSSDDRYTHGYFDTYEGPNLDGSAGYSPGGYTGPKDWFDGGGPGKSGDTFQGGGKLSDIANAVTGRGPEAKEKRNMRDGGIVQLFQEGGDVSVLPLTEQVYNLTVGTDLGAMLPQYEVAGRTAAQERAAALAGQGIGAYEGAVQAGQAASQQGIAGLRASTGMSDRAVADARNALSGARSAVSGARGDISAAIRDLRASTGMSEQAVSEALRAVAESGGDVSAAMQLLQQAGGAAEEAVAGAMPLRDQAIAVLQQAGVLGADATMRYDPRTGYQEFMDPYLEDVIRQTEADIFRQGQLQSNVIRGQAAQAGAFGGSRAAVAERELGRNIADQQARMSSQLRSEGFRQAQAQAQQAFESQQQRRAQAAALFGQLGQAQGQLGAQFGQLALQGAGQRASTAGQMGQLGLGIGQLGLGAGQLGVSAAQQAAQAAQGAGQLGVSSGQLGLGVGQLGLGAGQLGVSAAQQAAQAAQGIGQLGMQQAQIGQMGQQMRTQDINTMLTIGAQQQAQRQAELDAARMNQYQQVMAPYQQVAFRSDILQGMPTGITTTMTQPGANPATQLGGLLYAGRQLDLI